MIDYIFHRVDQPAIELAVVTFNVNRNVHYRFHYVPESEEFFRLVAETEIPDHLVLDLGIIIGKTITAVQIAAIQNVEEQLP